MTNRGKKVDVRLALVVFSCSAVGMIMELVASRVLAPYAGTTIIVWTNLIGVILGALSLGYVFGGRVADRHASFHLLSTIILMSGISLGLCAALKETILIFLLHHIGGNVSLYSFVVITILFGPTSILIGMVTPYVAKMQLISTKQAGKVVGNIFFYSGLGSILGTFAAGLILIPLFGNLQLLYFLSASLIVVSLIPVRSLITLLLSIIILTLLMILSHQRVGKKPGVVADIDSQYNRIIVLDSIVGERTVRHLTTGNLGSQSKLYLDNPNEIVSDYIRSFRLSELFAGNQALMIGGGGFVYPRDFLLRNQSYKIDVVEIDPVVSQVATEYLYLSDIPRLRIINQDARTFIRNTTSKYNFVFIDAFSGETPPYQLTTSEFLMDIFSRLTSDGVLFMNVVASIEGVNNRFLVSQAKTIRQIFPQLEVFSVKELDPKIVQNLLLVSYKNTLTPVSSISAASQYYVRQFSTEEILSQPGMIFSDDHAPVEYLTYSLWDHNE